MDGLWLAFLSDLSKILEIGGERDELRERVLGLKKVFGDPNRIKIA